MVDTDTSWVSPLVMGHSDVPTESQQGLSVLEVNAWVQKENKKYM